MRYVLSSKILSIGWVFPDMGTPPKKIVQEAAKPAKAEKPAKANPPRKLTCYVMPDRPEKPGLVLVSTTKVEGGCSVLGWQPQSTTWLVSEGTVWYGYASNVLKVNLAFTAVFALCLLVVLVINRVR